MKLPPRATAPSSPTDGELYVNSGVTPHVYCYLNGKWRQLDGTPNTDVYIGHVIDVDGNIYHTVMIGNQEWMAENLNVAHYNNGVPLKYCDPENSCWGTDTTGACACYHITDYFITCDAEHLGLLYNFYAVEEGALCPWGWHVPSNDEFSTLINCLGGADIAGGKMKATSYWDDPNTGADNSSLFSGRGGGYLTANSIGGKGQQGWFWTSSANSTFAYAIELFNNTDMVLSGSSYSKANGYSVRCIRDN